MISVTDDLTATLLEGGCVTGSLYNSADVTGMVIRKCKLSTIYFDAYVDDGVFESCWCYGTIKLSSYVRSLSVTNSKIYLIKGSGATVTAVQFINCAIAYVQGGSSSGSSYSSSYPCFVGVVMNSIMQAIEGTSTSYSHLSPSVQLINVLYSTKTNGSSYWVNAICTDCTSSASTVLSTYTTSAITENPTEVTGTDGTTVGITGGTSPYTLVPSVPSVSSSSVSVDTANRKLNVSITVTAN